MKILIYGAGAVGLGIGSCLLKSGDDVDFIARADTVASLRKYGLRRTGIFGEYHADSNSFYCYSSIEEMPVQPYDYIIVSTKSYDSLPAAKDLSVHHHIIGRENRIVLCQNGWGNAEAFIAYFPEEQIYNARVITGFVRPEKHHVNITVHAEAVHIGSLFGGDPAPIEYLCHCISKGDIPCEVAGDIGKDLWAKMLYNCALNPLGAILNVPYGELGESAYTRELMNCIVEEIFEVMKESGHETHWKCAEDYLETFYHKLVPSTAAHNSSMLQDIKAKKRTEIDALNGAVLRLAAECHIDTPYNFILCNMIRFLEMNNSVEPDL
jgi:2-dehydropantoate 2-reductase